MISNFVSDVSYTKVTSIKCKHMHILSAFQKLYNFVSLVLSNMGFFHFLLNKLHDRLILKMTL